jgi:hypothetical protein
MSGEVQREALRNELARVTAERDKLHDSAIASAKAIGCLLEERAGLYATAVLARDFDALGISVDALRQQARRSLENPVDMSWWPHGDSETGATS